MMITKDVVEGKFNKDSVEKQMEEVKGRAAMHHRLLRLDKHKHKEQIKIKMHLIGKVYFRHARCFI